MVKFSPAMAKRWSTPDREPVTWGSAKHRLIFRRSWGRMASREMRMNRVGVLRLVLDALLQDGEAILPGGLLGTDGGHPGGGLLGHRKRAAAAVLDHWMGPQAVGLQVLAALGQGLGVGHGGSGGAGGFPGGQAVLHLHVHGAHNVKTGSGG